VFRVQKWNAISDKNAFLTLSLTIIIERPGVRDEAADVYIELILMIRTLILRRR